MHAALVDRLEIETDLRRALDAGQFLLHDQPTIELATGAVVGAEALIRWQHPTRGLIQPGDSIAIAEDTGQIVEIGAWVMMEACAWASRWRRGDPTFTVAVNVSGRQLVDGSLVETVQSALDMSGLPAEALVLEMTESTRAVVRLGTTMSLKTVAEGIEEHSQLAILRSMGCSIGQGFLFSRPVPAEELDAMVRSTDRLVAAEGRILPSPTREPLAVERTAP